MSGLLFFTSFRKRLTPKPFGRKWPFAEGRSMAGFSGLLHHGARASVANGHRTQPVGTIEVSASPLSPAASRTEHALLSCVHARDKFDA